MKRILFSFLLALTAIGLRAQTTFQSGDFTYVVLDEDAKTAALSRVPEEYRGAVVVPETVVNEGTTYTVTQIGSPASTTDFYQSPFYCCTIESLTIPATVTKVTGSMFYYTVNDPAIQQVTIADSPNPITFDAIGYLEHIDKLYIGRNIVYDNSVNGDNNTAVFKVINQVEIGPLVTTLCDYMFSDCGSDLTSVDLSNATGLTTIGNYAFNGCGNEAMTSIDLSKTKVTSIGNNAFYNCIYLAYVTLPQTLLTIGDEAFCYCNNLATISIPASVTTIGERVFFYTDNIKSFTIEDGTTTLACGEIGYGFSGETFYLGRNVTYTSTSDGQLVFTNVKNVTIGPNVTTLNDGAFRERGSIESFDLSNATGLITIGNNAFNSCCNEAMTSIDLSKTKVTSIGNNAFYNCIYLAYVTLPQTLLTIGDEAFCYCNNLATISIPASVTTIGERVFFYTDNIKSFTIEDGTTTLACGEIGYGFSGETFYLGRNVTYTSTSDGQLIYMNVKNVTLGPNVTTLSNYMFARPNLETFDWSQATGITTIPERCFDNCDGLRSFTIPANITTIEASAFSNMDGTMELTIEDSDTPLTLNNAGSFYPIFEYNSVTAYIGRNILRTGSYENQSVLNTNSSYEHHLTFGPKVTTIGDREYYDCDGLKTVDLSNANVTSIGANAFRTCSNLTTVNLGTKLETLGVSAFTECSNLSAITIPATLKVLPNPADDDRYGVFERCYALATVTLNEGLEEIGHYCFYNCTSLTEITLPSSLKKIGRAPFYYADAMKRLIVSDSETALVFDNNPDIFTSGRANLSPYNVLDYFYLGRNITRGTDSHSLVCDAKDIEIGPKVTNIDNLFPYTGDGSINVENVKVHQLTPIAISKDPFHSNTYANATLWVPGGTMDAYKAADYWKNFTNMDFSSFVVSVETTGHGTLAVGDIEAGNGESESTLIDRETDITFTVAADNGYELTAFTVNDESKTLTDGSFTVENLLADQAASATFAPITYTIAYTLAGGTATNPATYNIETETFTLAIPTREGYDFAGWTGTDLDGVQTTVTIAQGSTGNRTYTATWTPTIYTITLTLDGGSAENPATYTIESEAITLTNPTKTGYTFKGWKLNGEGEALASVTIAAGSTGNVAYTATWQINQYTITFDSNGGTSIDPITQDYASEVAAPEEPTRMGYTFAGWTPAVPATMPAENLTLTAQWTINQYTITFDTNGGSTIDPITQDYNTAVTAPADPTREGYTFAGWDKAVPTTMPAENMTVTASWTPVVYTIAYNLDGGAVAEANPTSYTIESTDITLNNPTKEYYDFAGWTGTGLAAATKSVTIAAGSTGNRSYTATWTAKTYTVSITGSGVTADNYSPQYGDDVVITIDEDEDRTLTSLTVNGTDVTAQVVDNQYTIKNVTGNVTVVATFTSTKEFITISAIGMKTFSCSQDLNFTGSEVRAYIASGYFSDTKEVLLTRVYSVPAGTGVLLKADAGTYKIPYAASQAFYSNLLKGVLTNTVINATADGNTNMILAKDSETEEYMFCTFDGTKTLSAQLAYLQIPTAVVSGARSVGFVFEEDVTSFENVIFLNQQDARYYNVGGQRVSNPKRGGLYIDGAKGKKVVVKK